jgi:hypothetical protein
MEMLDGDDGCDFRSQNSFGDGGKALSAYTDQDLGQEAGKSRV